jgi:protein-tyrosine-phosphatase
MVKDAKQIIVMCEKDHCPEFLLESKKINYWQIEDPYHKSLEEMRCIRDEIKDKVKIIIF